MAKSRTAIRAEASWRQLLLRAPIVGRARLILLTEYPKSGGTWVGQMLSSYLGVDFPRHKIPSRFPCIMHGHYIHHYRVPRTIVLWRDPRDVMVSWYHHCVFRSERTNPAFVEQVRNELAFRDFVDVRSNLPDFIEYAFNRQKSPRFNWNQFFDSWHGCSTAIHTSYELFRQSPVKELLRIAVELGVNSDEVRAESVVEAFTFENMAGRKAGQEQKGTFLRKGVVGDWKTQFTKNAAEVFDFQVKSRLVEGGFETSSNWVDEFEPVFEAGSA